MACAYMMTGNGKENNFYLFAEFSLHTDKQGRIAYTARGGGRFSPQSLCRV